MLSIRQLGARLSQSFFARHANVVRSQRRRPLTLEAMEPRLLLSGDPYSFAAGALTVTGTTGADTITIEQKAVTADGGFIVDLTINGSAYTIGDLLAGDNLGDPDDGKGVKSIEIVAGAGNDTVRLASVFNMDVTLAGGEGSDTLFGPNAQVDWYLDAAGAGSVGDSGFTGFEFLRGGSAVDSFKFEDGGTLAGDIDGGGGSDNLISTSADNSWLLTAMNVGSLNGLGFASIENLLGGTGDDSFVLANGAGVSGTIDGGTDDSAAPAVDSFDYSAYTTAVTVNLATSAATGVAGFVAIDTFIGGQSADDQVVGPADASVLWNVTGADETEVAGFGFSSFENLTGAADNTDAFVIASDGSISGTVDGGARGTDGLAFIDADDNTKVVNPAGADAAGTTTVASYGKVVKYAGIDHVEYFDDSNPLNPIISATVFNDTVRVFADPANAGGLKVTFGGNVVTLSSTQVAGLQSLRIDALDGSDNITVESLPVTFTGSLIVYGNRLQRNDLLFPKMPEDDPYPDTVTFSGDISLGYLEVFADHIKINDNVDIAAGDDGIFFRSRMIGVSTVENLLPVFATTRAVSVDVGKNASLSGGSIYFVVQAEDKSLADVIGATKEVSNFVIDPLTGLIGDALALPVKVLVKQSSSSITLQEGARITSSGTVGMYATAGADASGTASSSMISVGYAQAKARAEIDIQAGVEITASAAVVITATGGATANISATTQRELDSTPNPGGKGTGGSKGTNQVAVAIGVAYADVFSHVTMDDTAVIFAGKTANITAGGTIESEAKGEAGIYGSGAAGLGFGIEISKADIHTEVNGKVTANMAPGAVVKLEIDPLVASGATYTIERFGLAEDGRHRAAEDRGDGRPVERHAAQVPGRRHRPDQPRDNGAGLRRRRAVGRDHAQLRLRRLRHQPHLPRRHLAGDRRRHHLHQPPRHQHRRHGRHAAVLRRRRRRPPRLLLAGRERDACHPRQPGLPRRQRGRPAPAIRRPGHGQQRARLRRQQHRCGCQHRLAALEGRRLQHLRARPGGRLPRRHGADSGPGRRQHLLRGRVHQPDQPAGQFPLCRQAGDRPGRVGERIARRRADRHRPVHRHRLHAGGQARAGFRLRHRPGRGGQVVGREQGRAQAPA